MKLRHIVFITAIAIFLTACNFTLAADVTPPPGYASPTPMPTLGPLYPASKPSVHNGGIIFAEKCAPCHGETGLGNGPQSKDLPVTVPAIGLPEIARKADPSAWYTQVTRGNLERFMPPFSSLSDQERWDVVAYAMTLHTTTEQIETGKSLFEENCADCAKDFENLEKMSVLSDDDLIQIIKNGSGDIAAFGKDFTDEEALAVAVYLRTLTFDQTQGLADSATETPVSAAAETPSAEITPDATEQAGVTPEATMAIVPGTGNVSGTIDNRTGAALPSDLIVKLRAFDHSSDPNAGPQETGSFEMPPGADGAYVFENMEIPENRIFIAEVEMGGITYQTDFGIVEAGMTELVLPPLTIYGTTEDLSTLKVDAVQMFFDFANADAVQIFAVYSISNTGDKTILVKMGDNETVPFIAFPEGAKGLGYEATQDSASFVPTADGFAMPPSETPYGLIAFSSMPKAKEMQISQPAILSTEGISLFLPEGVEAEGATLLDEGLQSMDTMSFHVYSAGGLQKGESIEFTLSGSPESTSVNPDITQNQTLLIGVGAFGVVLILAGAWLYLRDRRKQEEEMDEDDGNEYEDPESIMDAIIALDDLHRAGKIPDGAYQQRRNELKNALKRKS